MHRRSFRGTATWWLTAATVVLLVGACSTARDDGAGSTSTSTTAVDAAGTAAPSTVRAGGPSAGCDVRPAEPPGSSDRTITSEGVERTYELEVPESYDGTRPYALVLGLHALTVSYKVVPSMTGFPDMFPTHDFIGVAPSGLVNGTTPYWNAAPVEDNYDVAFLSALLDHLEATLCLDTGRVFSTGMSNGAQMSALLACRIPERIRAIGAVAGVEFLEPCRGEPVPVIAFHGTEDPILPYAGGGLNATRIAELQYYVDGLPGGLPAPLGIDDSMRRWAEHNGCAPDYVEEQVSPEVRRRTWSDCDAATVLYIVDGGGHAWPGKPVPQFEPMFGHATTEIDASSLIFSFFFDPPSE